MHEQTSLPFHTQDEEQDIDVKHVSGNGVYVREKHHFAKEGTNLMPPFSGGRDVLYFQWFILGGVESLACFLKWRQRICSSSLFQHKKACSRLRNDYALHEKQFVLFFSLSLVVRRSLFVLFRIFYLKREPYLMWTSCHQQSLFSPSSCR